MKKHLTKHSSERLPLPLSLDVNRQYLAFLSELANTQFSGDLSPDTATRLSLATDNSIYQVLPQGAIFPRSHEDLLCVFALAKLPEFRDIQFVPRGGGTGTNGQALNTGIVIDLSRHMCGLVKLDIEAGYVRVQPGIVRDQLNDMLRPYGYFFAPTLSTSNRATIGGMVGTDACGQGSRIYGRTSNHVLAMNVILADGNELDCRRVVKSDLSSMQMNPRISDLYARLFTMFETQTVAIHERFPKLNRFATGYNLPCALTDDGLDIGALVCGSEGTLSMVSEVTLKLTKIPAQKHLVVLSYDSFDATLRAAKTLVDLNPDAIETIDNTILDLAKDDVIWEQVGALLQNNSSSPMAGVNLIEFSANTSSDLDTKISHVKSTLATIQDPSLLNVFDTRDAKQIASLWELRKKGVGLLGNMRGERRPVPFVEDTAVPPEYLADYIVEFRALLDSLGVTYGMFGHVDAGCLHVRPALNMRDSADAALMVQISHAVEKLVRKYQGVMWGEHGKGFRSEYTEGLIGEDLYNTMRKIKGLFDPHNQLNPGKICTPANCDHPLVEVADTRTRGNADKQIPVETIAHWEPVVACNGNGACFNYDPQAEMCPSYKATRDRIQSPKGRASLLREWLRQDANGAVEKDLEMQLYQTMRSCLVCKACTTQCPIKVDIPTYRSRFLDQYFQRNRRPIKDYLVGWVEEFALIASRMSKLVNFITQRSIVQRLTKNFLGLQHMPVVTPYSLSSLLAIDGVQAFSPKAISVNASNHKDVIILQDVFTSCFDVATVKGILNALVQLGFKPWVMPLGISGKAKHVKGMASAFNKTARCQLTKIKEATQSGLPVVAIDPSVGLSYREEYKQINDSMPQVMLLQEWLSEAMQTTGQDWPNLTPYLASYTTHQLIQRNGGLAAHVESPLSKSTDKPMPVQLLAHCSEKALVPATNRLWQDIFAQLGIDLVTPSVGCCGMAGTFGHEVENARIAEDLYQMSWQAPVSAASIVLATGYSCRSQTKLHGQFTHHPLHFLSMLLQARSGC